ncbi:hypothetical protein AAHZ94_18915 [Streptomyces sp. HSW2009]|uniref:hypothetical protein n=1 Tax=Streptomyces sp. HSW2009 TaxID=3142890 RepID=UPI0032EF0C2A
MLLLNCATRTGISLSAVSVRDGSLITSASGDMPADANPGGSYACHDGGDGYPSSSALRQMFNEDYSLMAGRMTGPANTGRQAVAFDVRTGLPVGPGADDQALPDPPQDSYPVFHDGDLWYVDGRGRLRSRPPLSPAKDARDRGPAVDADGGPLSEVSFGGGVAWRDEDSDMDESAVHPTGGYIAEHNPIWNQLQLREHGAQHTVGTPLSRSVDYGGEGPEIPRGSAEVPDCAPEFWLSNRDLICSGAGKKNAGILRVRFTADLEIVRDVEPLPIGTGAPSYGAVPSPDKKQIAFLAERAGKVEVYRQQLRTGAHPVKIAETSDAGVTYLLGWN